MYPPEKNDIICVNCGRNCGKTPRGFTTRAGFACMGCEFKEIEVYTVSLSDGGGVLALRTPEELIENLKVIMQEAESGDSYVINKRKMKALHFHNLEEFAGF